MSFESALVQELATGELAGKVFPLNAPEGTVAPYLIYLSSEGSPDSTLQGFLNSKAVSGELNILHTTYGGMKALTATVLATFVSFQGRSIGTSGPFIQEVSYDEPVELWEPEVKLYRCNISFKVNF